METLSSKDDGVAHVRLDPPPVNAVNRKMIAELRSTFVELSEDRTVGAVVLSAEGEKAFCAGVDLNERRARREAPARTRTAPCRASSYPGKEWRDAQHAIRHCTVPVIVAVDGVAIASGFGLVGSCDIIFASPRARFGLTEINVGLLGGSSKALRMVGPYKARTMFFTGDLVPASEFYRLGAIEEIVEDEPVAARAMAFARKLAKKSPSRCGWPRSPSCGSRGCPSKTHTAPSRTTPSACPPTRTPARPWPPSWRSASHRGPGREAANWSIANATGKPLPAGGVARARPQVAGRDLLRAGPSARRSCRCAHGAGYRRGAHG